jgi:glucose-1-phosphate thymidylyltransferase
MKGIVLAGGVGSRLFPATKVISKQLLPIHDKPLIYYPISTLMLAGIREIAIISKPEDRDLFQKLLGDGHELGISFTYLVQKEPRGIAECFLIAEEFIGEDSVSLILGDNIFYGVGLGAQLSQLSSISGAVAFAYHVHDPERYGVIEFNRAGVALSIEEKPKLPKSNFAIPGLYFFDNKVIEISRRLVPSERGELEITDVLKEYLNTKKLNCRILERGTVWLDTGTWDAFSDATNFIRILELRQGNKIACLEEIAWRNNFISQDQFIEIAKLQPNENLKNYLLDLIE